MSILYTCRILQHTKAACVVRVDALNSALQPIPDTPGFALGVLAAAYVAQQTGRRRAPLLADLAEGTLPAALDQPPIPLLEPLRALADLPLRAQPAAARALFAADGPYVYLDEDLEDLVGVTVESQGTDAHGHVWATLRWTPADPRLLDAAPPGVVVRTVFGHEGILDYSVL